MAEKQTTKPHSFWSLWGNAFWEGAKKSREGYGLGIEIFTCVLGVGFLYLYFYSKHHRDFNIQGWEELVNFWVAISPILVGMAWFLGHVFYQPYKMYRDQFDKHAQEMATLQAEHAAEMQKRDGKIAELLAQIESINAKLAERSDADKLVLQRQLAKELLGYKLSYLRIRRDEVREIGMFSYDGEVANQAREKTNTLLEKIVDLLNRHLGPAEVEMFNGAKPSPLPEPQNYDMFTERSQEFRWHLNWLDAKYAELKKIIEKLG